MKASLLISTAKTTSLSCSVLVYKVVPPPSAPGENLAFSPPCEDHSPSDLLLLLTLALLPCQGLPAGFQKHKIEVRHSINYFQKRTTLYSGLFIA